MLLLTNLSQLAETDCELNIVVPLLWAVTEGELPAVDFA